jgi:hypothetical protein
LLRCQRQSRQVPRQRRSRLPPRLTGQSSGHTTAGHACSSSSPSAAPSCAAYLNVSAHVQASPRMRRRSTATSLLRCSLAASSAGAFQCKCMIGATRSQGRNMRAIPWLEGRRHQALPLQESRPSPSTMRSVCSQGSITMGAWCSLKHVAGRTSFSLAYRGNVMLGIGASSCLSAPVFHESANPSVEGTSSSGLRPLPAAPHLKR